MQGSRQFAGWLVAASVLCGLLTSGSVSAQVLERVLMPGPVIAGHAEYEDECASCHQPFARDSQRELCAGCHTEIRDDIAAMTGFHGRSPTIPQVECRTCHTEHVGRDADVVGLERDTFNHDLTDFPLLGSHQIAGCDGCHTADVPFRDTDSSCISCHREEEPHNGNLGEACQDCHSETRWGEATYDHDMTDFPLTGKHVEIECRGCHRNEVYVDTPANCVSCHRVDDVHAGRNGENCDDCHTPSGWAETSFDHFKETGFALTDGHGNLACNACHEDATFEEPPASECFGCHAADDVHAGNNGNECDTCHSPTTWPTVSFDHAEKSGFALNGAHADLVCTACHRGPVETATPEPECNSCHWSNDVHQSRLGETCQDCHSEIGWDESVRFDHDLTEFPLVGLHAAVACEGCHADPSFLDTDDQCVDCHSEDDVHMLHLGPDCAMCHNPNDWRIWQFDHNAQTDFVLDGSHQGLDCLACHNRPANDLDDVALSTTCGSCHRGDDIHATGFGMDCGRCHTTEAFSELK